MKEAKAKFAERNLNLARTTQFITVQGRIAPTILFVAYRCQDDLEIRCLAINLCFALSELQLPHKSMARLGERHALNINSTISA